MRLEDFDYELPPELIAQTPLEDRDASRLLVLNKRTGEVIHSQFREVPRWLRAGDLLVMNDTRVTALRLYGEKRTGGRVEALLLRDGAEPRSFEALVKPSKRLRPGTEVRFEDALEARIEDDLGEGRRLVVFDAVPDLASRLAELGRAPLPPYITTELQAAERYQTVYASRGGSSAAPTAGLHFTPELLAQLEQIGVQTARVTLDVGLDTFRPVADLATHQMHGERCAVSAETAEKVARAAGRVIAVGTTTVRTLETHAVGPRQIEPGEAVSCLFIQPGFRWKVIDGMFTNFHMPRTTMLMMLAALVSRDHLMEAYAQAMTQKYRFLSFGDSMLILD